MAKKLVKPADYQPTKAEIKKGTNMEADEHKDVTHGKKSIAKKIALDHLVGEKMPTYYDELPKMEKKLKSKMVENPGKKSSVMVKNPTKKGK